MVTRFLPALFLVACAFAVDVSTFHNDNARTGQNLNETALAPSTVVSANFGKLFSLPVDGRVDAEPLYLSAITIGGASRNVVYAVTEHDSIYAFDADTGAQLWRVSALGVGETTSDTRSCSQVTPEIGITSTPVISRTNGPHGTIYVVAMTKDSSGQYHQRLHALDLTTGAEQFAGPREIQAQYPGTGENSSGGFVIFDPKQYKDRAALLLLNGVVYISFASHCDIQPYTGWIMGYDANTLAQTSVLDFTPNGAEGSVWMAGAGPAADSSGNVYFLAANGTFETTLTPGGFPNKGDYGNAFLKLSTSSGLAVADYFTMFNTVNESSADQDLGSGGAMLLPDMTDSGGTVRHLAVGAGKDGHIYLVDRDNMGKFNPAANSNYQDLASAIGSEFAAPAYFNGALYYGGSGDVLKYFKFSNARLVTPPMWTSANSFGYPGVTPSISANGNTNGIVWAVENSSPAILHAYDATDLHELYNSNQAAGGRDQFGSGNKFMTPAIADGKVFVGTPNSVAVFGILPAVSRPSITSSLRASGTAGRAFSYRITATNSPTGYGASGLPAGLTVNTSTGVISGTPTAAGTSNATISATNSAGTGSATLVITIKKHGH